MVSTCNGTTCSFSLADNEIVRYTTILGQSKERILRSTPLKAANGTEITWTIETGAGDYLDQPSMMNKLALPLCTDNLCSDTSYPNTGVVFKDLKNHQISVSGTIVNQDGSKTVINEVTQITTSLGKPEIVIQNIDDSNDEYTFAAELDHLGLDAKDYTLDWSANDSSISNGDTFTHTFVANIDGTNVVKLTVKPNDTSIAPITVEKPITLGELKSPEINIGSVSGKSISVSANTSNLPNNTIYMWGVEGQSIDASGLSANLNLSEYATKYEVVLTAITLNNGVILTSTKEVTTGYGLPSIVVKKVSSTVYGFSVNTKDTGLPTTGITYE